MATPTKPDSRLGAYILKTFKDESFRAYVPPPLPPNPPLAPNRSCHCFEVYLYAIPEDQRRAVASVEALLFGPTDSNCQRFAGWCVTNLLI
jgi:hypothetical protein